MKKYLNIILIIIVIFFTGFFIFQKVSNNKTKPILSEFTIDDYYSAQDSIIVLQKLLNKSYAICEEYEVKIATQDSVIKSLTDLVNYYKDDALVYRYKIERIRQYNKIVEKNSSQSVYFRGWVKRVIED